MSRPVTVATLIGMLIYPVVATEPSWRLVGLAVIVVLAGAVEAYFSIRVGFDAALFHQLTNAPEGYDFAAIDSALTRLRLLPAAKSGRCAAARVVGAKRLFGFQILALVTQVLSVLIGPFICVTWR